MLYLQSWKYVKHFFVSVTFPPPKLTQLHWLKTLSSDSSSCFLVMTLLTLSGDTSPSIYRLQDTVSRKFPPFHCCLCLARYLCSSSTQWTNMCKWRQFVCQQKQKILQSILVTKPKESFNSFTVEELTSSLTVNWTNCTDDKTFGIYL